MTEPRAYYNEIDKFCVEWLRNLIIAGLIAGGDVDDRDIRDVRPADLIGYTQCHFFAGIGGWSAALRLAGWRDDRPVWTGSCPCQPFSQAGRGRGFADERHLWPSWHWLIEQCRPDAVFGEQVASPAGRTWVDLVSTDMEGIDYSIGPIVLPAASVGTPGERHRLWFVADANDARSQGRRRTELSERADQRVVRASSTSGELGDAGSRRSEAFSVHGSDEANQERQGSAVAGSGFWSHCDWIPCRDGKYRPVEPGTFPLAHGVPARVGRLRGYGNAINPHVAAEVIAAYMEIAA